MHKQDIAVKYRPDLNYNKNQIMSPTEVRKHGAQRTVFRASKAFTFPLYGYFKSFSLIISYFTYRKSKDVLML